MHRRRRRGHHDRAADHGIDRIDELRHHRSAVVHDSTCHDDHQRAGSTAIVTTTTATTSTAPATLPPLPTLVTTTIDPALILPTLAEGATGPDVVLLQRMLNNATGTQLAPDGVRTGPRRRRQSATSSGTSGFP